MMLFYLTLKLNFVPTGIVYSVVFNVLHGFLRIENIQRGLHVLL